MKDIESQAIEYAEALNDIADVLDMPTGATSADIVKKARSRWANGIHTYPEQLVNAARVLAFAKANGFPCADILYWNSENPEYGMEIIEELMEDGGTVHVTLGITLNAPAMECHREWDEEGDELGPVIYRQNA